MTETFVNKTTFQKENEDQKTIIREWVMGQVNQISLEQKTHKAEVAKMNAKMENLINENQKETIWKIKECEELLKTRITELKVESDLQTLEKKIAGNLKTLEAKMND